MDLSGLIAFPKHYECSSCEKPQSYVIRYIGDEEIVDVCPACGEAQPEEEPPAPVAN